MIERFSELKKTTQKGQDNIAFNRWRWTRAQREREREKEREVEQEQEQWETDRFIDFKSL